MSTFNRNTLALALAAALLPASAFAVTLGTGPLPVNQVPEKIASADIIDGTTTITLADDAFLAIQATDNIIGRTTGFGIRLLLSNGAEFTPAVAGSAGPPVVLPVNDAVLNAAMSGGGWTATVAAGNGTGTIVLSVSPNGSAVGVPDGDLLTLPNIVLDKLAALQTPGTQIKLTVEFFDSVSTDPILNNTVTPLLESGNPLLVACDLTGADLGARIDVGVGPSAQPSKTQFSSTGVIGLADQGEFNAGDVTINTAIGFTFAYVATDAFTTVVEGSFNAFKGTQIGTTPDFNTTAFLAAGPTADCATATAIGAAVTNAAADKITFDFVGTDVGIPAGPGGGSGPFSATVCFPVAAMNTTPIDATTVKATTTFTRGTFEFTAPQCELAPMQFNGSVVKVFTFNPAGNTTQQSFARVTNWGNIGGLVTVEGYDDTGTPAANDVTFNLAAGGSVQFNSSDLENGGTTGSGTVLTGAFGDGTGKWRLVVTGEFDGMHVTSLNRNNITGTLTNLTDSDNRVEQVNDGK